jgi:predicted Zn-dependent protease
MKYFLLLLLVSIPFMTAAETDAPLVSEVTDRESLKEDKKILENLHQKIGPAAMAVCASIGKRSNSDCYWYIEVSSDSDFNAYATARNTIVLHKGVFEALHSKAEIAFVLSHEIAHHIADHINQTTKNAGLGGSLGVLGAIAIGAATGKLQDDDLMTDLLGNGVNVGSKIGVLRYSRDQEFEADKLALTILHAAGFTLEDSRGALIYMYELTGKQNKRSSFFDTHPTPAERIIAFDKELARIASAARPVSLGKLSAKDGVTGKFYKATGSYCIYKVGQEMKAVKRNEYCLPAVKF